MKVVDLSLIFPTQFTTPQSDIPSSSYDPRKMDCADLLAVRGKASSGRALTVGVSRRARKANSRCARNMLAVRALAVREITSLCELIKNSCPETHEHSSFASTLAVRAQSELHQKLRILPSLHRNSLNSHVNSLNTSRHQNRSMLGLN
jgi:hypothetical protein